MKPEATTRRRYDTAVLVQKLQREQRRGLFLGVGSVLIVIGMVAVYIMAMRGAEIPSVPADPSPRLLANKDTPNLGIAPATAAAGTPAASTALTDTPMSFSAPLGVVATAHAETAPQTTTVNPATAPAAPAPLPGTVLFHVAKNAHIWLDNAQTATEATEVDAGKHVAKAKIGKTTLTQAFQVASGETVEVHIDARHKRLVISRPTVAVSQPASKRR
ncbi:MAG: hypothetical protein H7Z43_13310 [Clostridia bacterium]|nr:hypothetical protein [Deltaproteobacteria bacterium]